MRSLILPEYGIYRIYNNGKNSGQDRKFGD